MTDFAHDYSASVTEEFLRCTENKTLTLVGDSNTRNSFVSLLCRFEHSTFLGLGHGALLPPFSENLKTASSFTDSYHGGGGGGGGGQSGTEKETSKERLEQYLTARAVRQAAVLAAGTRKLSDSFELHAPWIGLSPSADGNAKVHERAAEEQAELVKREAEEQAAKEAEEQGQDLQGRRRLFSTKRRASFIGLRGRTTKRKWGRLVRKMTPLEEATKEAILRHSAVKELATAAAGKELAKAPRAVGERIEESKMARPTSEAGKVAEKTAEAAAGGDAFYRNSGFKFFNGFQAHYSALYYRAMFDHMDTIEDTIKMDIDKLLPKYSDVVVLNVGVHLQNMCTQNGVIEYMHEEEKKKGRGCCLPFKADSPECYAHHFRQMETLIERIHKGGYADRIIWRVTYPQRKSWTSSIPHEGASTTSPFAGREAIEESARWDWDNRGWPEGFHKAEIASMTSPRMKAIGLQVLDVAEMIQKRHDSHTEPEQDRHPGVHHCVPGPLDDVNSLILNALCG
jgi:hypothetical protein